MGTIIISNILKLIIAVTNFYLFMMFILAVLSILGVLGLVNIFAGDTFSSRLYFLLRRIINPLTNAVNRFLPQTTGLDLGFLVVLLLLWIIKDLSLSWLAHLSTSMYF